MLNVLKEEILQEGPEHVVNLKTIEGADYIVAEEAVFRIGALAKLADIAESQVIQSRLPILSQAAASVATPIIRNSATIGGNICQDTRCEHYRSSHYQNGRKNCYRKGGDECLALEESSENHSVFGGMKIHESACTNACPAEIDIPAYMDRLRTGDIDGAIEALMTANPIPALTGRACAHFCQQACIRSGHDESVAIRNVERYLGDYVLANSKQFYPAPSMESGKKVAIVGSGPGGLSAAYYLRKAGHRVVVYDKTQEAGGMLRYAIPAYRLPRHFMKDTITALENMGVEFVLNTEVGKDMSPEKLEKEFDKVLYSTGAWKRPVIGFDGEELTVFGLKFLSDLHNCTNDKLGKDVLVIGGGSVAMDVATTAKRLGAENVTLVCLESEREMPAVKEDVRAAREQGVTIVNSWGIGKVIQDGKKIKGMEFVKCLSVFDTRKRFSPKYDTNDKKILEADSIFMAVGQAVDLSFLKEEYQLKLSPRRLVEIDETTRMTSKKNVYAGGDMTTGPATVALAIKSGRAAADAMNNDFGVEVYAGSDGSVEPLFLKFDAVGTMKKDASELPLRLPKDRSLDQEDRYAGLSWEEAKDESTRCFNCACLAVNPSDISPVLVALDATVRTTERGIEAADFFTKTPMLDCVLSKGELVKEIEIPAREGYRVSYEKLAASDAKKFAVLSVASAYKVEDGRILDARIVLGGVAPVPYRVRDIEEFVKGKRIDRDVAAQAGQMAYKNAALLSGSANKMNALAATVRDSLLNAIK